MRDEALHTALRERLGMMPRKFGACIEFMRQGKEILAKTAKHLDDCRSDAA